MSDARHTNNTRSTDRNSANQNRRKTTRRGNVTTFKGEVEKMQGNVFQLHTERKKRGQFQDTIDAMKVLSSTEYKTEVYYMEPLFRALDTPNISYPVKSQPVKVEQQDGSVTEETDQVLVGIYKIEIHEYVKKTER